MLFVFPYCASGFLGWQVNWFWTYFLYSLQGSGIWDTLPHCFVSLFTNQWISWMCVAFVYFVALDLFFVLFDTLSLGQFVLSLCSHIFLTRPAASSGTFTHTEKKFHSHSINANLNIFSNHCKRNKKVLLFSWTLCSSASLTFYLIYAAGYWIHLEACASKKGPHLLSDFRILHYSRGSLVEQSQKDIQLFAQVWKASVSQLQNMLLTRMNLLAMYPFYCKILAVWNLRPLLQIR